MVSNAASLPPSAASHVNPDHFAICAREFERCADLLLLGLKSLKFQYYLTVHHGMSRAMHPLQQWDHINQVSALLLQGQQGTGRSAWVTVLQQISKLNAEQQMGSVSFCCAPE